MRLIVIGDIHAQFGKFWQIMTEANLCDQHHQPSKLIVEEDVQLVLLGDLVHSKSRERYSELTKLNSYDEFNPQHLRKAEVTQEHFLHEVKGFQEAIPEGKMTILMGNHDFNAVNLQQGPLRTDDVSHLEWKGSSGSVLEPCLLDWIATWPVELIIKGLHLAHVGPNVQHNTYDDGFYVENRRRWIYDDQDYLKDTPYELGVYGHTPVRGGVNIASQGKAILLDSNGFQDEYSWLEIEIHQDQYRLRMRGLFFDEWVPSH